MAAWDKDVYGDVAEKMRVSVQVESLNFASPLDPGWVLPSFWGGGDAWKLTTAWINDVYAGKATVADGLKALKPQLQAILDKEDPKYKG